MFFIGQDVEELLQCVCDADSVQEVERFGSVLVQRLQLARQRRNDITAQEMKAVLEERDVSVAKVSLLSVCLSVYLSVCDSLSVISQLTRHGPPSGSGAVFVSGTTRLNLIASSTNIQLNSKMN